MRMQQNKLANALANEITRTKLYKSGKLWVAAAVTVAGVGTIGITQNHIARAAMDTPAAEDAPPANIKADSNTLVLQSSVQNDDSSATDNLATAEQPAPATSTPSAQQAEATAADNLEAKPQITEQPITSDTATPTPNTTDSENTASTPTPEQSKDTVQETAKVVTPNPDASAQLPSGAPKSDPVPAPLVDTKDAAGDYSVSPNVTGGTVALNPEDAAQYFTATNKDGDVLEIRPDGTTTLTDGHTQMVMFSYGKGTGYLLSDQQIDFLTDFSLSTTLTSTYTTDMTNNEKDPAKNPWLGGDGISLFFEALDKDVVVSQGDSGQYLGLVNNTNKYPGAKDTLSFNISTNASGHISDYTDPADKNKWYLFQAGSNATKPTSEVVATGITLEQKDGSISYTFVMKYTAADRKLITQVFEGDATATADPSKQIATWNYDVPEAASHTTVPYTLGASASIAESKATYTAQINYYTYHPATGAFAIKSAGLPEGDSRPDQSDIKAVVGDTILFYPEGTTPAASDAAGHTYAIQIAVPKTDAGYVLKTPQAYTIESGEDGLVTLKYGKEMPHGTTTSTRTIHYLTEDGKTVAPDLVQTIDYSTTTDGQSTIYTPKNVYESVTSPQPVGLALVNASQATIGRAVVQPSTGDAPRNAEITVLYKAEYTYDTVTVARTIHYVTDSGRTVAPDTVQNVEYKTVSLPDGTTIYTPTGFYAAVDSPTGTGLTLLDPSQATIMQKLLAPTTNASIPKNEELTVKYADPTYTYGNVTSTRTIHYETEDGKTVAPDLIQTIDYKTATDSSGHTIYTPQNVYELVTSPTDTGMALKNGGQATIARETVAPSTTAPTNSEVTVIYINPSYTYGEVTVNRIINYRTEDGKTVAPDVIQPMTYKTVTDGSGKTVYTPQNQFTEVASPTTLNLVDPTQATIPAASAAPTTTTPTDTKVTVLYAAPEFTHGSATSLRTIHYVDGNGQTVAPDLIQTIIYASTTDPTTGRTVYTPQNVYAESSNPTIPGYTTQQKLVLMQNVGATDQPPANTEVTVVYTANPVTPPDDSNGGNPGGSTETTLPPTAEPTTDEPTAEEPSETTLPDTDDSQTSQLPDTFGGTDSTTVSGQTHKASSVVAAHTEKNSLSTIQTQSSSGRIAAANNHVLPQTGDQQNHTLTLLGTIAFVLSVFGLAIKRRSSAE